jgi:outer membrane lipoprotein-sorting protein
MLRWTARIIAILALILSANFVLAQTEFSADIVDLQKAGETAQARIYFAKDKFRVEPQNSAHGAGAFIVNFSTQTSTVLITQQHMYMEMPAQSQSQRTSYASAFFRTGDVENACGDWQKSEHNQGSTCKKVGSESINGRSAVKYEATSASGEVTHFWLDPKLRFPIKWQSKNSDGELRNIQEGAQPASLFEVPAGFTQMKMPAGMMQQPH